MEAAVELPEAGGVDVSVYLRRADVGVAEQLLYRADVRAVRKHVRRERVPQDVRRNALRGYADRGRAFADDLEDALPGERTPEAREEQMRLRKVARERASPGIDVPPERRACRAADRHKALLAPLAENPQELAVGDYVVEGKRAGLADAKAAAVHRLEKRTVAQRARVVAVHRLEHRRRLGLGEDARQDQLGLRRVEKLRRVAGYGMALLQVAKERPYRRSAPGARRPAHPALALHGEEVDDVGARNAGGLHDAALRQELGEQPQVRAVARAGVSAQAALEREREDEVLYFGLKPGGTFQAGLSGSAAEVAEARPCGGSQSRRPWRLSPPESSRRPHLRPPPRSQGPLPSRI